jgi:hypothetical protein
MRYVALLMSILVTGAAVVVASWAGTLLLLQHASAQWPTTAGVVTSSELIKTRGSKGRTNTKARVIYTYTVDGKQYSNDEFQIAEAFRGIGSPPRRTVAMYPVGATPGVWYNPRDPSESLLEPGLRPTHALCVPMALGGLLGLLALLLSSLQNVLRRRGDWIDGFRVLREPNPAIRLTRVGPALFGLLWGMGVAFVAFFVGTFALKGVQASGAIALALVSLLAPVGVAVAAATLRRASVASGRHDLVVDLGAGLVKIPAKFGRREDLLVPIETITDTLTLHDGSKHKHGQNWRLHLAIGASGTTHPILERGTEKSLRDVERWVREYLGLSEPAPDPARSHG